MVPGWLAVMACLGEGRGSTRQKLERVEKRSTKSIPSDNAAASEMEAFPGNVSILITFVTGRARTLCLDNIGKFPFIIIILLHLNFCVASNVQF